MSTKRCSLHHRRIRERICAECLRPFAGSPRGIDLDGVGVAWSPRGVGIAVALPDGVGVVRSLCRHGIGAVAGRFSLWIVHPPPYPRTSKRVAKTRLPIRGKARAFFLPNFWQNHLGLWWVAGLLRGLCGAFAGRFAAICWVASGH